MAEEDEDEYVLSDEVRVAPLPRSKGSALLRPSPPPPPPGSRASRDSAASPVQAASGLDVMGPPPPLPTAAPPSVAPPPLPPRKPGLPTKHGSVIHAAPAPEPVPVAVAPTPAPTPVPSPAVHEVADAAEETQAKKLGRREKKQNRMSSLLERLTPRRAGGGGGGEEEEFVISAPSDFAHRAHGETGLAQLVDAKDAAAAALTEEVVCNVRAVALWPFVAAMSGEISLQAGEVVLLRDRQDEAEWWLGTNSRGELGFFPANVVRKM